MERKQAYKKIPESLKKYREDLFWGLSRRQVVLLSVTVFLLVVFARMLAVGEFMLGFILFLVICYAVLELVEWQGRSLAGHLFFRLRYEYLEPKVYCYLGSGRGGWKNDIHWKSLGLILLISTFSIISLIIFVFLIVHVVF